MKYFNTSFLAEIEKILLINLTSKITMFNKIKKWLKETLDIIPHNLSLYITALIHPSYRNEHHLNYDYEKLEFFGDAIII